MNHQTTHYIHQQQPSYPQLTHNKSTNISIKRKLEQDSQESVNRRKRIHHELPSLLKEEDKMIIEDEYTDEDESLQTPSAMDYYDSSYYIPTNVEEDLDKGGFTGQLELGWTDLYYDMY